MVERRRMTLGLLLLLLLLLLHIMVVVLLMGVNRVCRGMERHGLGT
jgi:hypothetical protein